MDRSIVYAGALPRSVDILSIGKFAMFGIGALAEAMIGTSTSVAGLGISATGPASLNVVIGKGSIYTESAADVNPYGGLGTDASVIMKQGLLSTPAQLSITPPTTAGYSQVFVVQVALAEVDGANTILPYFNAANPSVPFSGPNGSGSSQSTIRSDLCVVSLKAGTAAPTGSQTVPAPDPGYVGLYAITVANGQTSITSANWYTLATAPFIIRPGDAAIVSYGANDTGTSTAYAFAVTPAVTAYADGHQFEITPAHTNTTTTPTLNIFGIGALPIVHPDGSSLGKGEIVAGQKAVFAYDSTLNKFVLLSAPSLAYLDSRYPKLTLPPSPATFYVDGTLGNDTNAGTSSGAGAFQTPQGAVNAITSKYISVGSVTLAVADNTYNGFNIPASFVGSWNVNGNATTPANCLISASSAGINDGRSVFLAPGVVATFNGFKFTSYFENASINSGAFASFYNIEWNLTTNGGSACAFYGASGSLYGSHKISGTGLGWFSLSFGEVNIGFAGSGPIGATVNYNAPTFTQPGVIVSDCGILNVATGVVTISGSATGVRWAANRASTINVSGAGVNYFLGSSAGANDATSSYV